MLDKKNKLFLTFICLIAFILIGNIACRKTNKPNPNAPTDVVDPPVEPDLSDTCKDVNEDDILGTSFFEKTIDNIKKNTEGQVSAFKIYMFNLTDPLQEQDLQDLDKITCLKHLEYLGIFENYGPTQFDAFPLALTNLKILKELVLIRSWQEI